MSYSNHALDAGRANFNVNYTRLSERFHAWESDMKVKYGNSDPCSEFSTKMDVFMKERTIAYMQSAKRLGLIK
jgi:glutathionylspermidine synthase